MEWKDVADAVAKFAPIIGKLVADSTDELSVGVNVLTSALSHTGPVTPDNLATALKDPAAGGKLLAYQNANLPQLLQFLAPAAPPAAAPTRNVLDDINAKNGRIAFWSAAIVSTVVTVGFFVAFYLLTGCDDKSANSDLHLLVGALIAGFTQVISYYLGSSSGSAAKTQLMAAQGNTKP